MDDDILEALIPNVNKPEQAVPPTAKEKPAFFNNNVFGDDYEIEEPEEIIEDIPPPPVFSEKELEAAKQLAFNQGKAEGKAESMASREQFATTLLQDITQSMHILIAAENQRETRFQQESVALSLQIFEQLFPYYKKTQGFEEIKAALLKILQEEDEVSQILIEVHPDYVSHINQFIKQCSSQLPRNCCYEVVGTTTFNDSQFKLSWKDGGAAHDIDSIALRIRDIIHSILNQGDTENIEELDISDKGTVFATTNEDRMSDDTTVTDLEKTSKTENKQSGDIKND